MTSQVHDKVLYEDENWTLAAYRGRGLFDPSQHGLYPIEISTANHRGWVATYRADTQLQISRLEVGLSWDASLAAKAGRVTELGGVRPVHEPVWAAHRRGAAPNPQLANSPIWVYDKLTLLVPFTGRLLITRDGEAGAHPVLRPPFAWRCNRGIELRCRKGLIVGRRDRSEELLRLREQGCLLWPLELLCWALNRGYPRWRD